MTYTIEIQYQTGDSFGSHDETDRVGYSWIKIEQAEKALNDIEAHYKCYQDSEGYHKKNTNCWKKAPWSTKGDGWENDWRHQVLVEDDEGNRTVKLDAFWTGYFERLHVASVVTEGLTRRF